MANAGSDRPFVPSGFFAFRTPLLPFEELEALSAGLAAASALEDPEKLAAAVAADKETLRARIRALLDRPEVLEAVFLASPSLVEGLEAWRSQPDGKKGQRAERALVRYLFRMAARATPFGLFSGCSLGPVSPDSPNRLAVVPRAAYERHTRLDMDYLFALCEDLGKDPQIVEELLYRPNSSLYRAAGRLRYAEARLDKKIRTHHLVAVDATEYLEDTLRRAAAGARARDLAQALVDSDPDGEITFEEAREYIGELIDSQLLVSDLSPPVTGPEAIHDMIAQLQALAAVSPFARAAAERLIRTRDTLAALDAGGPGSSPERYQEIAQDLEGLPTSVEMARLFQLDMVKAVDQAGLGGAVLDEIVRGVEVIHRLAGRGRQEALDRFRNEFTERYGDGREVPLVEVLDEEIGIGFERSQGAGAEASPLLQGLIMAPPAAEPTVPWGPRQGILFRLYIEAIEKGKQEITLTDADLDKLAPRPGPPGSNDEPPPLPRAFQVMATIAAPSEEALDRGEFQVQVEGVGGPSGARLLGRFCHADPQVHRLVEEHLRAEEALRPDAVFAEVVHLPQGRIGNILSRPVLREYEIPYLGRSGAPLEHQIPITDLLVTIAGGRIVLRSQSLGREVIPALTSAHNFWTGSLGMYRFLCILQNQGTSPGGGWTWGPLDGSPFLPRVTYGRLLLSRATWYVGADEIERLGKPEGMAARFAAVRAWAAERGLPRLISLADGDNELLVDLDNVLSADTFVDVVKGRDRAKILEFFPQPDQLWARGPEGRFVHEVVIPFVQAQQAMTAAVRPERRIPASIPTMATIRRTFPPGSEWLYLKLYTGTSTADRVLVDAVAPAVHDLMRAGAADGWFFIRYGDPGWHVRLRFHGEPAALQSRVLPAVLAAAAPMLEDGRLWQVLLDTYQREVERYGGAEGMPLAERIFQVDSEAVLAILEMIEGDEGTDARWRLALRGADMLLSDLGLEGERKLAVLGAMKESFGREFGMGKSLRVQLDQKFRAERKSLDALLDPANDETSLLAPGLAVLHQRSQALAPLLAELERMEREGRLNATRADLAPSFVHMHVNRMIRSAARAHELAIYDLLFQLHQSRAARERGRAKTAQQKTEVPAEA